MRIDGIAPNIEKPGTSEIMEIVRHESGIDKALQPKPKSFSFLKKLRSELDDSQRKYLNLFWYHYLEHRQWPKTVDFHRDHDIKEVQTTLKTPPLNGSIVMEQTGSGSEYYELRLVGILLTKVVRVTNNCAYAF
jgi:hypothetical protein